MAFSNTFLLRIPLHNEVIDEEHILFHTIDRMLVRKLIRSRSCTSDDAIDVVAFLLWLEREKLSVNVVYKVLIEWPNHLVGMLAEQVLALLEWLRNNVLVWERRGDISLIQELCHEVVSFVDLYERRFEIMEGKHQIKSEIAEMAFPETFPREYENRNVQDRVGLVIGAGVGFGNIGGGVGNDYQNIVSQNNIGLHGSVGRVGLGVGGVGNIGQREVLWDNIGRVGLGIGSRVGDQNVAGEFIYDPQELMNESQTRVQFGSIGEHLHGPQELESNFGAELANRELQNINRSRSGFDTSRAYIHDPRRIMNENHYGVGYGTTNDIFGNDFGALENIGVRSAPGSPILVPQTVQIFVRDPQHSAINQNILRYGKTDGIYLGNQQLENINDGGSVNETSSNNVQILLDVPYGPRMGYMDTNGQIQRSNQVNTRRPIPDSELSVLLRGLNIKDEETNVHEDDRTVFLTFSRGYPLTESEIWGFFTRKFGNFIKGIHFEEVGDGEQPLYARLVAQNSSIIPLICDVNVNAKTKYVINGKHVWAKKYIRKRNVPPPSRMSSSASTSRRPYRKSC